MDSLITIFIICIFIYFIMSFLLDSDSKKSKNKNSKTNLKDAINVDAGELLKSENKKKLRKQLIQKKYKSIAKFYNNYKFIDYSNPRNKKILTRQMNDIINIVDKNLK